MPKFRKCRPETPREGRTTKGKIEHFRAIDRGRERHSGRGKVFAGITVERGKKERGPYPFVIKKFPNKEDALEELQKAIDLREADVPVPGTVRYAKEKGVHMLLYSDLTEGGKYEVWSENNPRAELFYLDLTEEDIRASKKLLAKIAQEAASAGYRISRDAYFLRREHDGSVEVIIGDLGWGVIPRAIKDNKSRADDFIKRIEWLLGDSSTLRDAFRRHTYKRLLPLTDGIRIITDVLERGGHSREEMVAVFEKCNIGEEAEDLLTRPLESNKYTRALYLDYIENVNLTLATKIRSGDLSTKDLEKAATLYRHTRETNERLRQRIEEAGLQVPRIRV